jgi:hypothetical protein
MTASVDHGRHRQLVSNSFVWAGYININSQKATEKIYRAEIQELQECRKKMSVFFLFLSIL